MEQTDGRGTAGLIIRYGLYAEYLVGHKLMEYLGVSSCVICLFPDWWNAVKFL